MFVSEGRALSKVFSPFFQRIHSRIVHNSYFSNREILSWDSIIFIHNNNLFNLNLIFSYLSSQKTSCLNHFPFPFFIIELTKSNQEESKKQLSLHFTFFKIWQLLCYQIHQPTSIKLLDNSLRKKLEHSYLLISDYACHGCVFSLKLFLSLWQLLLFWFAISIKRHTPCPEPFRVVSMKVHLNKDKWITRHQLRESFQ